MSQTRTVQVDATSRLVVNDVLSLAALEEELEYWQMDMARDGFAIIKGAIPLERNQQYADEMLSYLEDL
jgi:hypothetical protein